MSENNPPGLIQRVNCSHKDSFNEKEARILRKMKTVKVSPELETEMNQKGTKKYSTHFNQKLFTCDKAALRKLHL